MNKWIERLCFSIILLLAFFGFMIVGIIFHEKVHQFDLKKLTINGTQTICLLEFPINESMLNIWKVTGSYNYLTNETITKETKSWTELRAYSFESFVVGIPFIFCVVIVLISRWNNSQVIKTQEKDLNIMSYNR